MNIDLCLLTGVRDDDCLPFYYRKNPANSRQLEPSSGEGQFSNLTLSNHYFNPL